MLRLAWHQFVPRYNAACAVRALAFYNRWYKTAIAGEFKLAIVANEIYDPVRIFKDRRRHSSCALWQFPSSALLGSRRRGLVRFISFFEKLINWSWLLQYAAVFLWIFSFRSLSQEHYLFSSVSSRVIFGAGSTILHLPPMRAALSWLTVSHVRMNHCQSRLLSFRYVSLIFPAF